MCLKYSPQQIRAVAVASFLFDLDNEIFSQVLLICLLFFRERRFICHNGVK